jgi:hypothetical protein
MGKNHLFQHNFIIKIRLLFIQWKRQLKDLISLKECHQIMNIKNQGTYYYKKLILNH